MKVLADMVAEDPTHTEKDSSAVASSFLAARKRQIEHQEGTIAAATLKEARLAATIPASVRAAAILAARKKAESKDWSRSTASPLQHPPAPPAAAIAPTSRHLIFLVVVGPLHPVADRRAAIEFSLRRAARGWYGNGPTSELTCSQVSAGPKTARQVSVISRSEIDQYLGISK